MASTTTGQRLKETREYLGYTIDQVCRFAGSDPERMALIEAGELEVGPTELTQLARLYQRPAAWFRTGALGDRPAKLPPSLLATTTGLDVADALEVLKFAEFLQLRKAARSPESAG